MSNFIEWVRSLSGPWAGKAIVEGQPMLQGWGEGWLIKWIQEVSLLRQARGKEGERRCLPPKGLSCTLPWEAHREHREGLEHSRSGAAAGHRASWQGLASGEDVWNRNSVRPGECPPGPTCKTAHSSVHVHFSCGLTMDSTGRIVFSIKHLSLTPG